MSSPRDILMTGEIVSTGISTEQVCICPFYGIAGIEVILLRRSQKNI